MGYSARYNLFSVDKREFFAGVSSTNQVKIRADASKHSYKFLTENRFLIEQEFNQMYAAISNKDDNREEFWLYCYYSCIMLQRLYSKYAYNKPDLADKYRKLGVKIAYRCENKHLPNEKADDDTFLRTLNKKIVADLNSLASTPKHTSQIRDWLGFTNIHRIVFVFSRLAVKQSLLLANELLWFEKLNKYLGRSVDVNRMVAIINAPAAAFNGLSVGLFAARFFVNLSLLLKHTFVPTHGEKSISAKQRFLQELSKRHPQMLNDIAWATINGLCNYSTFFNISAPVANGLTAGFLFFDVSLLIYRRHLAERDYLLKKAQYMSDKKYYQDLLTGLAQAANDAKKDELQKKYLAHCKMLDDQITQLDNNWRSTSATFLFNVGAAAILMGGFTASFLLTGPAGIAVSYIICTIAVAMYLSADSYGKYKDKSLSLKQCKLEDADKSTMSKALIDMQIARNDFILAMFKNTFMPLLIVTTFAICWQAALILTALYIAYSCTVGYFKSSPDSKKVVLPLLPEPDKEDEISSLTLAA